MGRRRRKNTESALMQWLGYLSVAIVMGMIVLAMGLIRYAT